MKRRTPGPWKIKGQNIIGNEKNGFVCTWSGRKANAHLISAAPDMYEALKEALSWLNKYGEHAPITFGGEGELANKICQALAKAEGKVS